jgi:DNA-directed RNA polymerase subunit E'
MYRILTVSDTVRVPPSYFTMDLNSAVQKLIQDKYERRVDMENGVVLKVWNVHDVKGGKVVLGDGAAYYDVKYNALTFIPEVHEIIEGEVSEVMDFGAFVSLGPFDGLVHLSQITNEFVSFDKKAGTLTTKGTKKVIKKGDMVRAKVVTVSLKPTIPETKIALTMKGDGLGKLEWLAEEKKPKKEIKKEKKDEKGEKKEKPKREKKA